MKDSDALKELFRTRLEGAELPVRDGFWEELQDSLATLPASKPTLPTGKAGVPLSRKESGSSTRWMKVAASLLLLMGLSSTLLWLTQPQEKGAELAVASEISGVPKAPGEKKELSYPETHYPESHYPETRLAHHAQSPRSVEKPERKEEEEEMVHVQVTIRIQEHGYIPRTQSAWQQAASGLRHSSSLAEEQQDAEQLGAETDNQPFSTASRWALKVGIGSALSKGDAHLPFTASLTAERKLGKRLAIETGVKYHCLPQRGTTYHTIAVPARLHYLLAASERMELYALAGGSAEKCVAGAPSNSFSAEPVRLAIEGGVGVRYRLSDRLALFAEPTLSHHFSTDSTNPSLRTERPTNVNLLCGLRVNY